MQGSLFQEMSNLTLRIIQSCVLCAFTVTNYVLAISACNPNKVWCSVMLMYCIALGI